MSRANSGVDTNSFIKRFTGVLENGKYSYKYFDKSTKEEIPCPEEGYELVKLATNVTNVGAFRRGTLVENVYVSVGPPNVPEYRVVALGSLPDGSIYGTPLDASDVLSDVVARGTWVTLYYMSGRQQVVKIDKLVHVLACKVVIGNESTPDKLVVSLPSMVEDGKRPRYQKK